MKPWKISSILFNSFFERNPIKTKSTSGRAVLNWPVEYIVKTQLKNYIINVCDVWNAGTFFSHFSVNYKRCRNCLIIMLSLCTCYAHNLTVYQKICTPLLIFPYINIIPKTWINLYSSFFFGVYWLLAGLSVYLIFFFLVK